MNKRNPVVRLIKNRLYPTYQLFATMNNNKLTPEEGLCYGALTVLSWLKERLGDNCSCPPDIPEKGTCELNPKILQSFHINQGFVIDVISLPEKGLWSLQITEPDLGSNPGTEHQSRSPVAGRIIETNVSLHATKKELQIGILTVISDPEHAGPADVYRPAFVKTLYSDDSFGLKQIIPIKEELCCINTVEQWKNFCQLCHNNNNQLPCILFTHQRSIEYDHGHLNPEQLKHAAKAKDKISVNPPKEEKVTTKETIVQPEFILSGPVSKSPFTPSSLSDTPAKEKTIITYQSSPHARKIATSCAGYVRSYLLSEKLLPHLKELTDKKISDGDALFIEPLCFGNNINVITNADIETDYKTVKTKIMNYCRGKTINFDKISFLGGARDMLMQQATELELTHETEKKNWITEKTLLNSQWQQRLTEKSTYISQLETKIGKLEQSLYSIKEEQCSKTKENEATEAKYQSQLKSKDELINYLQFRLKRPHSKKELPSWLKENFSNHIVLHTKAIQLLDVATVNPDRIELIYDALEFLATDYWDCLFNNLGETELLNRQMQKYNRSFTVTQNSDTTINSSPEQYTVSYIPREGKKPVPKQLDKHLKVGVKTEHLVRIYFFVDTNRKIIVVGSLPDHLDCAKIK